MIDFAVGRTNVLDLSSVNDLKSASPKFTAAELESPIYEFRLNYIVALKTALLNCANLRPEVKMYRLLDWMENEFIMCAPALQYANLLFSPSRKKGMFKDRSLQNIRNIAWDFALVTYWRRLALEGNKSDHPVLLVSGDKVVKYMAHRLVASDEEEFRSHVVDAWHPMKAKGEAIMDRFLVLNAKVEQRQHTKQKQTDDELDALTSNFEREFTKLV